MTMTTATFARTRAGHPSKFTPQAIEKIKESVKQGLNREEIAKLLDVTVGSLQVTCSRLGISLRQPNVHYPSYDRLEKQLRLTTVEKISRPLPKLAILMRQGAREVARDIPLSEEALATLGVEAAFRNVGVIELIAQVLCEAVKKDMVGPILDGEKRPA
jgi:hypothetical protein